MIPELIQDLLCLFAFWCHKYIDPSLDSRIFVDDQNERLLEAGLLLKLNSILLSYRVILQFIVRSTYESTQTLQLQNFRVKSSSIL